MKIEVREMEVTISGYVNAVCRDSRIMTLPDGTRYVEQVKEGVFSKAISATQNIALKVNHERVIGGTENGSLELKEDSIGLYAVAKVTDEEVVQAAEAGKITGWSFGFVKISDEWEHWTEEGVKRRSLTDIQLNEVSILVGEIPAYQAMSYEVRGNEEQVIETRSTAENAEISVIKKPKEDFLVKKLRLKLIKQEV